MDNDLLAAIIICYIYVAVLAACVVVQHVMPKHASNRAYGVAAILTVLFWPLFVLFLPAFVYRTARRFTKWFGGGIVELRALYKG